MCAPKTIIDQNLYRRRLCLVNSKTIFFFVETMKGLPKKVSLDVDVNNPNMELQLA